MKVRQPVTNSDLVHLRKLALRRLLVQTRAAAEQVLAGAK